MNNKKKFEESPENYPIDWSGKSGIYLHSEWLEDYAYDNWGFWVHVYRDVEGEKARHAYLNAQASFEDREFNSKIGLA